MLRCGSLLAASLLAVTHASSQTQPPAQMVLPPEDEIPEARAAIDEVTRALDSGTTSSQILSKPEYMRLHPWPRFRVAIRDHAERGAVTLVTPDEPGERLTVRGVVVDASGKALPGALVYAYQTSAKGWYAIDGVHFAANSGDERHARLFAYVRTDGEGRFVLKTIRPAGYPGGTLPQHIHVEIWRAGSDRAHVTEILFSDDPRLTETARARARSEAAVICDVRKGTAGSEVEARVAVP